jgi:hypothetical protein
VRDAGAWVRKSGAADRVPRAVAFLVLFWVGAEKTLLGVLSACVRPLRIALIGVINQMRTFDPNSITVVIISYNSSIS